LKQDFTQYELCGKATKYRWSYWLKGFQFPPEKCEAGKFSTNFTRSAYSQQHNFKLNLTF